MGVIRQGILGGFSGKVANVVGSSWKGIPVIKSLPLSVANPRSPGQVAQRNKLTTAVRFARTLLASIIQPYWNPFAQQQSGYNAFVSTNIAELDETGIAQPQNFYITRGSLLGVANLAGTASAASNTINISFANNTGQSDALGTDEAVTGVYNSTQDYWITSVGQATRSSGSLAVTDNVMVASDVLRVYFGFARPNASRVSDSGYISVTVGA